MPIHVGIVHLGAVSGLPNTGPAVKARSRSKNTNDAQMFPLVLFAFVSLMAPGTAVGPRRLRPRPARHGGQRRRQDPLRDARQGSAHRDGPRLSRLLVFVARPDGGVVGLVSGRGHRSARLQPERQAEGAGAVRHGASRQRSRAVVQRLSPGRAIIAGHDWGGFVAWSFAMRHPELTERLDHPQSAASARPDARAGQQSGTAGEFRIRTAVPGARRGKNVDGGGRSRAA